MLESPRHSVLDFPDPLAEYSWLTCMHQSVYKHHVPFISYHRFLAPCLMK